MKRILLAGAAMASVLVALPMFAAFEAHVVNVTATIENALSVPLEKSGLTFGEVFPQEVTVLPFDINLSSSFVSENNKLANEVNYMIRQKPKCGVPIEDTNPVQYSSYTQVTENQDGTFVCPLVTVQISNPEGGGTHPEQVQSVQLPLLCPYLSKHQTLSQGEVDNIGDGLDGINSFHGLPGVWNEQTTEDTQVNGSLNKNNDTSDTWNIDLHTPCFVGQCAQDWADFVKAENPDADPIVYQAPANQEHQQFGCDLWVEATSIPQIGTSTPQ